MMRFLLLIASLFLINSISFANTSSCTEHQCIAVIDAGSTGSRLHIFSYDLDETNTPINITEIGFNKETPGFATLELNQNTVNTYMNKLFSETSVQQIPVYFYATAGMRLIPQAKQKIYYQNLKNWFNQQSNWQLIDAKTITGNEEALYDWLSVNYHLDTLKSPSQTVGVLDIGGASTQIAFSIKNNTIPNINKDSLIELNLYHQHLNLFVHSFLGLGQNEMTHQLLDSTSCFANNYPLPNGEAGQGNASECVEQIASLINGVHKTNQIVQPTLAENPVHSWYALSGIAKLAESKPFHFPNSQLTNQNFLQQANNFACHRQWEELNHEFPENEYLDAYCLLPAFYYALMVEGYGFSPNQVVNYIPSEQNFDWTLGVVLHH
ncbi:multidrug DMT transporter permease [Legionella sp.]|uniref:multidrug DMT transporter permease n=1 Tax=Legionella sp. TaxID=459 RepID=UPI003C829053